MHKRTIQVEATVNVPVEKVWEYWTSPDRIVKWNNASEDWHTSHATNDLQGGGRFLSRMEAKDGSFGFDFTGMYDEVTRYERIAYTIDDGREVNITFSGERNKTKVTQIFEAENINSIEMQRNGWQTILDNFKNYVENN